MYKLIISSKEPDDLSIWSDLDRVRRQRELSNDKNQKVRNQIRNKLEDILRFVEHQQKETFGVGYKLTLTRNLDNSLLNIDKATNIGKSKINIIEWYILHYTNSIPQQAILSKQILSKIRTELQYLERRVCMKEEHTQKIWSSVLGTGEGLDIPIWILKGFQQKYRQDS